MSVGIGASAGLENPWSCKRQPFDSASLLYHLGVESVPDLGTPKAITHALRNKNRESGAGPEQVAEASQGHIEEMLSDTCKVHKLWCNGNMPGLRKHALTPEIAGSNPVSEWATLAGTIPS